MFDTLLCILAVNYVWLPDPPALRPTGFPLAFIVLLIAWFGNLLPQSAYVHETHAWNVTRRVLFLTVGVDLLQTFLHRLSHTTLRSTVIGKSHMVHHFARYPTPYDAFATGYTDAIVQLMLPVFAMIFLLQPDRTSLTFFGCFYSWWLHFLHSPPRPWHKLFAYLHMIAPEHHHAHHTNPSVAFANVFRACDTLTSVIF